MKKITISVAIVVGLAVCISAFFYFHITPTNALAEGSPKVFLIPREGYSADIELMLNEELRGMKRMLRRAGFVVKVATASGMPIVSPADESANNDNESQNRGWLFTRGNKIYQSNGKVWFGKGANIQDTRGCNACTCSPPDIAEVKRRIDELVDVWGANFLRLTLESYSQAKGRTHWQGLLTDPPYLDDISEIVDHIGKKNGVYVLISLWSEPTFSGMGWPTNRTIPVWEKLAERFKNASHVLYGIANEPNRPGIGMVLWMPNVGRL